MNWFKRWMSIWACQRFLAILQLKRVHFSKATLMQSKENFSIWNLIDFYLFATFVGTWIFFVHLKFVCDFFGRFDTGRWFPGELFVFNPLMLTWTARERDKQTHQPKFIVHSISICSSWLFVDLFCQKYKIHFSTVPRKEFIAFFCLSFCVLNLWQIFC